jgi:nucleotide-binding universal stress UspA family protein
VNESNQPICVERILVSLDNSRHSLAALQAAVALAQHYKAELKAVFVEDTTLLRLAEMPFCYEVGEYTATVRKISTDDLSRGISVQSRWVTQSFRKTVNQTDINAEIFIRRGNINETIDQESLKSDLIIIGKTGTNPLGRRRLGSTAKALLKNHLIPLLLVEENSRLGTPLMVYYDHSPLSKTCLETARALLDPDDTLIILLNEDDPDDYTKAREHLQQWSEQHDVNTSIQAIKIRAIRRFFRIIEGLTTGLLILPHDDQSVDDELTLLFLERISLPVLLIRARAET